MASPSQDQQAQLVRLYGISPGDAAAATSSGGTIVSSQQLHDGLGGGPVLVIGTAQKWMLPGRRIVSLEVAAAAPDASHATIRAYGVANRNHPDPAVWPEAQALARMRREQAGPDGVMAPAAVSTALLAVGDEVALETFWTALLGA